MAGDTLQTTYGQITPPDDNWKLDVNPSSMSFTEGGIDPDDAAAMMIPEVTIAGMMKQRNGGAYRRSNSSSSAGSSSSGMQQGPDSKVNKKDKYREKNRVAAAKCRAKKKEHVDGLEENHRTQSMLNSLLKQTEQNLRDELSFWRTQALQHAFCDCHAVQDYNLKKARALAADKDFGGLDGVQHGSSAASSPSSGTGNPPFYPSPDDYDLVQA